MCAPTRHAAEARAQRPESCPRGSSSRGPRRLTNESAGPARFTPRAPTTHKVVGARSCWFCAHTHALKHTPHANTHTTRQHTTPNTKLLMKHMQTQQIKTLLLRCPFRGTTARCLEKCPEVCSGVGPYLAARAALKRGGQRGHIGNEMQGGGAALYGVRNNVIAVRGGASLVRFAAARPRLHASARQPQQPPAPTLPWDGGQKNKKLTAL